MPKKETGDNSHKKPEKPISDTQRGLIHGDTPNTVKTHVGGERPERQTEKTNKSNIVNIGEIPQIDVIEGVEANTIAKSANQISRWSVIVSALLFGITLLIAYQAIKQSKAASDSVALARQTYLADSVYKHKNDSISKISDSIKKAQDKAVFNAQKDFYANSKKGIDSQISAIKQTQKQFEISHSPYITVIGFGRNAADSLEIDMQNQGTQVAYLVEIDCVVKAESSNGIVKKFKNADDWNKWLAVPKGAYNVESIFAPGSGVLQTFRTLKSVSDTDMNFVMQRRKILYIRVAVYYFNTTTNKYMRYDYIAGWNPVDNLTSPIYFNYAVIKKYPK